MIIYIVMGSAGEYSDREEWPIKAYYKKKSAEKHVLLATRERNSIINKIQKFDDDELFEPIISKYDNKPFEKYDLDRNDYFIHECELDENI